jgi:hypothetical protein
MHLRILTGHQKHDHKKDIYERLKCLKTSYDAFAHTARPPESWSYKMFFLTSLVVEIKLKVPMCEILVPIFTSKNPIWVGYFRTGEKN